MTNHFLVLLQPKFVEGDRSIGLDKVTNMIKGRSSHDISKLLGQSGTLWGRGYFDDIVNGEKSLNAGLNYLLDNPMKAKLAKNWEEYPCLWTSGMNNQIGG
jgi:hypothetical protein